MAGEFNISTINIISPNGLVTKPLTVDNYGYASIGDERVGVTPQNWIINGMFDVWQRGTSQTSSGYGSDDRWFNEHSVSTKTHSLQTFTVGQTVVPNNPTYFSRTVVSSGATSVSYVAKWQRIEDVTKLAGKNVTLSFWAKADASKNLSIEIEQGFGTGGSSSINAIGVQKFALTTNWQRFTKTILIPGTSGKTIGAGSFTSVYFWFDAGSALNSIVDSLGNQSGTFDIANVCLVEGSVPMECPSEPYAEVLRKCQRYYYRTTAGTTYGAVSSFGLANTTSYVTIIQKNPVTMRVPATSIDYANLMISNLAVVGQPLTGSFYIEGHRNQDYVALAYNHGSAIFSAGSVYYIRGSNNVDAYLGIEAEL